MSATEAPAQKWGGQPVKRKGDPRLRPGEGGISATGARTQKWVAQPIKRKEDPRLIMGRGRYVDDLNVTGQLWASFVRSPEGHARITSIDTSAAKSAPGAMA